ncbi:ABC transporter substrate-binding protein [Haloechinothrix sp. YIM 98757]|uniref:ABC transporter substrate-binding protein n=1 Tax=Haloechinothrix aidingensis TaxID=2752311 RepID=A0A838AAX6_9PSEU|nr:ABC transporter substrate-binding protein [Haloechinothrix aidingensis]MBA0126400.1 ABC transporter substrate-binding protein [Haloechinothrix aidingensis]
MPRSRRPRAVSAALAAGALALAGCGAGADEAAALDETPTCEEVDLSEPPAEPEQIRFGAQPANQEPAALQYADPEFAGAEHYGSWYTIDAEIYPPADRLDAFQAGQLDAGTASVPQLVRAAAQDLPLRSVASTTLEAGDGFATAFAALEGSGIEGVGDLEGKKIGILDPVTSTAYWARSAVSSAGLDPNRDVELVSLPVAEQEEALRSGTIDIAVLPQPFYEIADSAGGIDVVFDSRTGPGMDQELIQVFFGTEFISEHPEAYCAWREDYQAAVDAYSADRAGALRAMHEAEAIRVPDLDALIDAQDYARPEGGAIDVDNLDALIDNMAEVEFLKPNQSIPADELVLEGFSLVR